MEVRRGRGQGEREAAGPSSDSDGSLDQTIEAPDAGAFARTAMGSEVPTGPDTDAFARTAMGSEVPTGPDTDAFARTSLEEADPLSGSEVDTERSSQSFKSIPASARLLGSIRDGSKIDRFTVIDVLGAGGMGVVLAAFDPKLDRRVAIKMLHDGISESHGARLEREARAMAQLSHPNVLTVHETGTYEGRLYIAMEFVEGETLGGWLRAQPRSRDEVLDLLLQAGRGLAAAHDQGLVHRDFKPENVLVGKDGRARVSDFGLVSAVGEKLADGSPSVTGSLSSSALTMAGAIMGTPLYMSPEQHAGRVADAKADQFSYCVTLWQALCEETPYGADTYEALVANVSDGKLRPIPRGVRVPKRLRAILTRGLSARPEDRFPSMHELLAAIERTQKSVRWVWAAAGAAAIAAGATFLLFGLGGERDPCAGGAERLAGVWDPPRKQAIRSAYDALGVPATAEIWQRLEDRLDGYTDSWVERHRAVCEATQVRGEQSAELLDLRMRCLDQRLTELDALVERFGESPSRESLFRSVDAIAGLRDLAECDDVDALRTRVPLPTDPAARARISELEGQLAEAESFDRMGRYGRALELTAPVVPEARAVGYAPLEATAMLNLAALQAREGKLAEAEKSYREAAEAAGRARDDERLARCWIDLIGVLTQQGRYDDALDLATMARASAERVSDRPALGARLANNLAGIHLAKGDYPAAGGEYDRALELAKKDGEDSPILPHAYHNAGLARWYVGDLDGAGAHFQTAREMMIKSFGPGHPNVAYSDRNLGDLALARGNVEEAVERFRSAVGIWEVAHGADHLDVALGLVALAGALAQKGDLDGAREAGERALVIRETKLGLDHLEVAYALTTLADVDGLEETPESLTRGSARLARALTILEASIGPESPNLLGTLERLVMFANASGRAEEALGYYQRALAIQEKALGKHPDVASWIYRVAEQELLMERFEDAFRDFDRARALWAELVPPTDPRLPKVTSRLGEVRSRQKRHAEALALYEKAVAVAENAGDPVNLASIRYGMADALWAAGKRNEAIALAKDVRAGTDQPAIQEAIDAWLREHGQ